MGGDVLAFDTQSVVVRAIVLYCLYCFLQLVFLGDYANVTFATQPVSTPFERPIKKEVLDKARGIYRNSPIWIGVYSRKHDVVCIFDVSSKQDMYASGKGYHALTGRDASRALATMQTQELGTSLDDLDERQLNTLADWEKFYFERYPLMGYVSLDTDKKSQ